MDKDYYGVVLSESELSHYVSKCVMTLVLSVAVC